MIESWNWKQALAFLVIYGLIAGPFIYGVICYKGD